MTAASVYSVTGIVGQGYAPAKIVITALSLATATAGSQIDSSVSNTGAALSTGASLAAGSIATSLVVSGLGGPAAITLSTVEFPIVAAGVAPAVVGVKS
ncbi:MAG: hypothetical protein MK052_03920 [Alphaproteobacteria bacterium]|nr:hypothetical protein [Alphaproteobacteria bacterium]